MGARRGSHAHKARKIASTLALGFFHQPWHWIWIVIGGATVLLFTVLTFKFGWGDLSTKNEPFYNLPTTTSSVRDFTNTLHPEEHNNRDAQSRNFSWNITSALLRPDGVSRKVILINDEFPGPTIEARSGDTIIVSIYNHLKEGVSFHWHGLQMRGMCLRCAITLQIFLKLLRRCKPYGWTGRHHTVRHPTGRCFHIQIQYWRGRKWNVLVSRTSSHYKYLGPGSHSSAGIMPTLRLNGEMDCMEGWLFTTQNPRNLTEKMSTKKFCFSREIGTIYHQLRSLEHS